MEEKRKSVLKEKWEKEEMWKKYVPYVVQRKHFDQTFSKSLMVQVHEGAKARAEEGRRTNTTQNKKSRRKTVLRNLSLVKVSFAERKVLGGEKRKKWKTIQKIVHEKE